MLVVNGGLTEPKSASRALNNLLVRGSAATTLAGKMPEGIQITLSDRLRENTLLARNAVTNDR